MQNSMPDNNLRASGSMQCKRNAALQATGGLDIAAVTPIRRSYPLLDRIDSLAAPPAAFRGAPYHAPWRHPFGRAWRVLASRKTIPTPRRLWLHASPR